MRELTTECNYNHEKTSKEQLIPIPSKDMMKEYKMQKVVIKPLQPNMDIYILHPVL